MEFCIGDTVRFMSWAQVSSSLKALIGTVEGYEEVDGEDYVIVSLPGPQGKFDQWVTPGEIAPAAKRRGH